MSAETFDQMALRVAEETDEKYPWNMNQEPWITHYAAAIRDELAKGAEPVAWLMRHCRGDVAFGKPHQIANHRNMWSDAFPVFTYPPSAAARIAELEKQRDGLFDVLSLVIDEMEARDRGDGNAPGHGHEIPGVWDSDNGKLAGKPCAWCAVWNKAKELRDSIAQAKEGK